MHEIAAGPILYEDCLFGGNGVGLRNEQAERVTVRNCRFEDNTQSALDFVVKLREDGDTLRFPARNFGPGDPLNDGDRIPLTAKDLTFENNTFVTRVPGSRLVRQVSAASQTDRYLAGAVSGATWRGNRYFAADPPFAFELPGPDADGDGAPDTIVLFADADRWAAATGDDAAGTADPPPRPAVAGREL